MGGLEGASLSVKLKYLEGWNGLRREIAKRYRSEINNPAIKMQFQPDWSDGIHHLFVVATDEKARFVNHLENNNIIPAYHYPVPCHLQKAYSGLGYQRGDFPVSEYLAEHCISLPMYPELEKEQIDHVIQVVNRY
jgi:dTDP-4-amino-4,6-dideoxygalactose transaminase